MQTWKRAVSVAITGLISVSAMAAAVAEPLRPVQNLPMRQVPRLSQLPVVQPPAGSFALRCRGGPVTHMGFQQAPAGGYGVFNVHFIKGTKPADQGLDPAQCSWLDRGMAADETAVVCRELNDIFLSLTHVHDARYNPMDNYLLESLHSKSNPWVEKVRSPDEYFNFYVMKEGCLRIVG